MIEHRNPGEYPGVDLAILQALGEAEFVQWSDVHSFYAVRAIRSTQMSNCNPLQNYTTTVLPHKSALLLPAPVQNDDPEHTVCLHNRPAARRTSRSKANPGREYYCCARRKEDACNFFRWVSDLRDGTYGHLNFGAPVKRPPKVLCVTDQLHAWNAQQGTETWLRLRDMRLTASTFGTIHNNNPYETPLARMHAILHPCRLEGPPLTYGSINEATAFRLFKDFIAQHYDSHNFVLHEKGIWIPCEPLHFLGGSPDGILYLVDRCEEVGPGIELIIVRRHLLEIKPPWKLRNTNSASDAFYESCQLPCNAKSVPIPPYYVDQVYGNCNLIGLAGAFFVVMHRHALQITYLPNAPQYWQQKLLPCLCEFWRNLRTQLK